MKSRLLTPFILFTRLPFWRLGEIKNPDFSRAVELWPLVGWLTGGLMALIFLLCSLFLPLFPSIAIAFSFRLLITGALHEDGLADFFDGLGGGTTSGRILEIMKDSHIGTYGTIALILYFLLSISLVQATGYSSASDSATYAIAILMLTADPWSKFCASMLINILPYARKSEDAKIKIVYKKMPPYAIVIGLLTGALPAVIAAITGFGAVVFPAFLFPMATMTVLILIMKRRIGGYTGDCCGASFLLCELSFFLGAALAA